MSTVRSAVPGCTSRAVACLAIPALGLQCVLAERPELRNAAVALADGTGARVADLTAEAHRRGVRVGMALREAVGLVPTLQVLEPRPALEARYADALVEAMSNVSPLVEPAAPGMVFADLRGMEALYPRIEDMRRAVFAGMPSHLQPQLGIAGHRFTAQVAAMRAEPGTAVHVPCEEATAFLDPEPVTSLQLDVGTVELLHLLGVTTCGGLARLPRHAVEAQFGYPGGIAWLAARGEDPTPLRPRPWERERVVEVVEAEPPLVSREAILHALEQMLGRALRHPMAHRRFVRLLRLRAEGERGGLWEREQVLREPLGDRDRLWRLIRTQVEYASFPGPLTRLSLELGALTTESGRQHSLFSEEQTRRREQLDEMVRHLKVRFGQSPVTRVVPVEPWHRLPEHRYALLEYDP